MFLLAAPQFSTVSYPHPTRDLFRGWALCKLSNRGYARPYSTLIHCKFSQQKRRNPSGASFCSSSIRPRQSQPGFRRLAVIFSVCDRNVHIRMRIYNNFITCIAPQICEAVHYVERGKYQLHAPVRASNSTPFTRVCVLYAVLRCSAPMILLEECLCIFINCELHLNSFNNRCVHETT